MQQQLWMKLYKMRIKSAYKGEVMAKEKKETEVCPCYEKVKNLLQKMRPVDYMILGLVLFILVIFTKQCKLFCHLIIINNNSNPIIRHFYRNGIFRFIGKIKISQNV